MRMSIAPSMKRTVMKGTRLCLCVNQLAKVFLLMCFVTDLEVFEGQLSVQYVFDQLKQGRNMQKHCLFLVNAVFTATARPSS